MSGSGSKTSRHETIAAQIKSASAEEGFRVLEELRPQILLWPCSKCRVPVGMPCVGPEGRPAWYWHGVRAIDAGLAFEDRGIIKYHQGVLDIISTALKHNRKHKDVQTLRNQRSSASYPPTGGRE
jgi:hypothetical protein